MIYDVIRSDAIRYIIAVCLVFQYIYKTMNCKLFSNVKCHQHFHFYFFTLHKMVLSYTST